jgi:glycosyltransferase involved in cell wall biosynthesis
MKIILLSAANSIHTVRWANGLNAAGNDVHVISKDSNVEAFSAGVIVHILPIKGVLGYFLLAPKISKLLKVIKPDIISAHYASGYGTMARLIDHRPWVLSVWGSDVYDFPHKTPLHKWLIKTNLRAASRIASTSHCMANETRKLCPGLADIAITPFGVDLVAFAGIKPEMAERKKKIVIGTVKHMKPKYGVDTLIQAFALLHESLQSKPGLVAPEIELRLVGEGEQTPELQALAMRLGIADKVTFVGRVPHKLVPHELAKLDIYVALSRSESFGVAIIEAGAAGRPVVVSDAGGLPEVTLDGVTGFVVPRENPAAAAAAIERLVLDANLRNQMGKAAQAHVADQYSWDACIQIMLALYENTIKSHSALKKNNVF